MDPPATSPPTSPSTAESSTDDAPTSSAGGESVNSAAEPSTQDSAAVDVLAGLPWVEIDSADRRRSRRPLVVIGVIIATLLGVAAWQLSSRSDEQTEDRQTAAPAALPTPTTDAPVQPAWTPVFSDEFDGPTLDTSKWTAEHSTYGDGNNELQCHTPGNIAVSGGRLLITAKRESTTCPNGDVEDFSSGLIRSQNKFSTAYGRFEIRAKLPSGQGLWPAFWLLSNNYPYGRDGLSGELDVVEMVGSTPDRVVGTAHWIYNGCGWACSRHGAEFVFPSGERADTGFHTYALEWTPEHLEWSVDGEPFHALGRGEKNSWGSEAERAPEGLPAYPAPFDETNPMYLIVNLSVGGTFPGPPSESTPFPATMEVDWVRVSRPASPAAEPGG